MARVWPWLLGGAALGGVALAASGPASASGGGSLPEGDFEVQQKGLADVKALAVKAGLPKDWQAFFQFVAYGESGGNNLVGLGIPEQYPPFTKTYQKWLAAVQKADAQDKPRPDPSSLQRNEARAAEKAYERSVEKGWLPTDAWPKHAYTFGSGGWGGLLPAYGLHAFKGTHLVRQHPWTIFDGPTSLVMMWGFAKGLRGWDNFDGTVESLRVGWGWPAKMSDAAYRAKKRPKYEDQLDRLGVSRAFLQHKLSKLPAFEPVQLMAKLGAVIWLPSAGVA